MSTPYKNALDAFMDSDLWFDCRQPDTLGSDQKTRTKMLQNRLISAFEIGWNAAKADTTTAGGGS